MKICAVIITYNRAENIGTLISALAGQTYKEFDTVIFDASVNDKTEALVKSMHARAIKYIKINAQNAFEAYINALKTVYEKYDWLWLLHDDTIPDKNALSAFVEAISRVKKVSFFTSSIITPESMPAYTPPISPYSVNGQAAWGEKLEYSLVRIGRASFVSTFINTEAIVKCGVPTSKTSFGDNSEYLSKMISEFGAAYLVGKSKVVHLKAVKQEQKEPANKLKICAIVVTYNRKEMLLQCLNALKAQKYKDFDVLIVDNASTDGTREFIEQYLTSNIFYINTGANLGGSGGFYYGMKCAYERGYDWLWIMDDDVVPTPTALGELVAHLKYVKTVSFLASAVYSKDNTALNTPEISRYSTNGYRFWYDKLEYGMMRLAHATFVSLLINRKAVEKCGLPCKDYFIWGDDTEYTMRIIGKFGAAYMVGSSKVYHLRGSSSALNIRTEKNEKRIPMYYNLIRNTLLNARTYSGKGAYKSWVKRYYKDCIKIALSKEPYRKLKIKTILSAIRDFKKGRYAVEAFKNRYQFYGQEKAVLSFIGLDKVADELKGQFSYTVASVNKKASIFSMFEHLPAFIKEYDYDGINSVTESELRRNVIKDIVPITKNQYLVVDLYDSFNSIGVFSGEKDSFIVNYTDEFANDLKTGKLSILEKEYNLQVKSIDSYDEQFINDSITKFILSISKLYSQDRIILVKHVISNNQSDSAITNKNYNLVIDTICKKMPMSKVICISEVQTDDDVCSEIKKLLSNA